MNTNFDKHIKTGRTTRMLEHAVRQVLMGMHVVVFGATYQHGQGLSHVLDGMVKKKKDREKIKAQLLICSFSDATQGNVGRFGIYRNYDYRTNRWMRVNPAIPPEASVEVLVDHYAMETHLASVTRYLSSSAHIGNHTQWLIDTARMLSVVGRKVYVITDDPETQLKFKDANLHQSISVEDGEHMSNLNLLNQELVGAHPNVQLLIEPKMLERHFRGALGEANRWNLQ